MTTTKQTLIAARALIEKPENWTKTVTAKNKYGVPVWPESSEAVCWCSIGAIAKVSAPLTNDTNAAMSKLSEVIRHDYIGCYNDTHTHAEVLAMFDKAIEAAE